VRAVQPLADARLLVTFVDGTSGEVRMAGFLSGPGVVGSVFEALRDPGEFAKVGVVMGAVAWPNGADLAPDAMYDAVRERGAWTIE
jgi:hypothetical protein